MCVLLTNTNTVAARVLAVDKGDTSGYSLPLTGLVQTNQLLALEYNFVLNKEVAENWANIFFTPLGFCNRTDFTANSTVQYIFNYCQQCIYNPECEPNAPVPSACNQFFGLIGERASERENKMVLFLSYVVF